MGEGARLVVVGGGYIGLEVASVAARQGRFGDRHRDGVTPHEPGGVAGDVRVVPRDLHREAGVDVRTGLSVSGFEGNGSVARVRCADGTAFDADFVVAGIGITADDALASAAGLEADDGVLVDEYGATSEAKIWAVGDCTRHPSRLYGGRVRLESVHNAMSQAKVVAANICGKETPYDEAPWFWSDQYDAKLQIVGACPRCRTNEWCVATPLTVPLPCSTCAAGAVVAAETVNGMKDQPRVPQAGGSAGASIPGRACRPRSGVEGSRGLNPAMLLRVGATGARSDTKPDGKWARVRRDFGAAARCSIPRYPKEPCPCTSRYSSIPRSARAVCNARWPAPSSTKGAFNPAKSRIKIFEFEHGARAIPYTLHPVRRGLVHARVSGGSDYGGHGDRGQGGARIDLRRLQGVYHRLPLRDGELQRRHRQGRQVRSLRR